MPPSLQAHYGVGERGKVGKRQIITAVMMDDSYCSTRTTIPVLTRYGRWELIG